MPKKTIELGVELTTAEIEALRYDERLTVPVALTLETWSLAEFAASLPVYMAGAGWLVVIRSADGDLFAGTVPPLGVDEENMTLTVQVH
jgi:hypothetical protein